MMWPEFLTVPINLYNMPMTIEALMVYEEWIQQNSWYG